MKALKRRVLALIASHPNGIDSYDIAAALGCSAITVNAICEDLEREGKVAGA
jgi:DNA-binding IclR family transcriptional regulator